MKKGQVYEAAVERVDFPNKGIAQTGEGTVIVKNSLPGQKIMLRVSKARNGKAEGRLLEVLEKSPLETEPPCSHFGLCGGCTYLSLPYEEQLKIKEEQVRRLLEHSLAGQKEPWKWEGIQGSPEIYGYRNKMEFSFGDERKDGPLALGMHKRGSFYDVVTVKDCCIVDEDYRLILATVLDYFGSVPGYGRIPYFHKQSHEGYLRHLVVRKASRTGEILAALVTTSQNPREMQAPEGVREAEQDGQAPDRLVEGFRECLLNLEREGKLKGRFAGILHIINDSQADVVQSDRTDVLYGQDFFYEELLGMRFKITPFSFFQTNSAGAEVLYETAREYIGNTKDKVVFDLYSGTGTIAQILAAVAKRVVGVELVEEAVEAAKENAAENGLKNCSFIAGDVGKVMDELTEKPDLIVLDPPRDGIHPKAMPKIIRFGVERIVYISCKPTSLIRDLVLLQEGGYQMVKACSVDMFPHTGGIETVVELRRL